jgi:hypothetical protein
MDGDKNIKKSCFVIQPFDDNIFDKRYNDIFAPAIEAANLEPYRVDKDPEARIIIERIEKGISNSALCFAEITTNNPNVWYELGFAFACKKDVIMVACPTEREGSFPFDIQHRKIINYKTSSSSDFDSLKKDITRQIEAFLKTPDVIEVPPNGLATDDLVKLNVCAMGILLYMITNTIKRDNVPIYEIEEGLKRYECTEFDIKMSIRDLEKLRYIELSKNPYDYNSPIYCKITENGFKWVEKNKHEFAACTKYS